MPKLSTQIPVREFVRAVDGERKFFWIELQREMVNYGFTERSPPSWPAQGRGCGTKQSAHEFYQKMVSDHLAQGFVEISKSVEVPELLEDKAKLRRKLRPWLSSVRRAAWKPVVKKGDGEPSRSKFAGAAFLTQEEAWPMCPGCQQPLQLLLQLNFDELPSSLRGSQDSGLLQLFYCRDDELSCPSAQIGWQANADCQLIRIFQPKNHALHCVPPVHKKAFTAKVIVGWKEFDDYPCDFELQEHGLIREYEYEPVYRATIKCPQHNIVVTDVDGLTAEEYDPAYHGDKLGGYPCWSQGPQFPQCRQCGAAMTNVLFQLASEGNLPIVFGDVGTGHIFQCPAHKNSVAFTWECS